MLEFIVCYSCVTELNREANPTSIGFYTVAHFCLSVSQSVSYAF
jgi:hypothetical protein